MDTTVYYIMNKLQHGLPIQMYEVVILFILVPTINFIISHLNIMNLIDPLVLKWRLWRNKANYLQLVGTEFLSNGHPNTNFSYNMRAICWHIHNKIPNLTVKMAADEHGEYILGSTHEFMTLDNDVEFLISKYAIGGGSSPNGESENRRETIKELIEYWIELKSKTTDLIDYVKSIELKYDEYLDKDHEGKIYHFLYKGYNPDSSYQKCKFSEHVLFNINKPDENYIETLDVIFNENSSVLKNDIKKLDDVEYFRRTKLKRKRGYLFYGPPGCGKTSTIMAISNTFNRHIIEVPMARITKNEEFEDLLNMTEINDIKFKHSEIIIVFDEIDRCDLMQSCNIEPIPLDNNTLQQKNMFKDTKTIHMGTILSRLDGIGNYDGIIVIATTNNKDILDPALYREMRLTPIEFNKARHVDIVAMIEFYFNRKMFDWQKACIPIERIYTPAKIKFLLERSKNIDDFLNLLGSSEMLTKVITRRKSFS